MTDKRTIGIGSIVLSTFLYSFFGVLTKNSGFAIPFFWASTVRNMLGGLVLLVPLLFLAKFKVMTRRDFFWLVLRTLGGLIGFVGSYLSFYYLPMGTACLIFYGGLVTGGVILGTVIFKENLDRLEAISFVGGLLGLAMIYSFAFDVTKLIWMLWALFGGLGTASWNVFAKKISQRYSATQLNMADFFISGVFTVAISLFLRETWTQPSFSSDWLPSYLLVGMFIVTGNLMILGFKYLEAQKASLLMLLEILFTVIIGRIVYHEVLSVPNMIGGILILLAAALPELDFIFTKTKLTDH